MELAIGDRLLVTEREDPPGGARTGADHLCRVVASQGPGGSAPYVVLRYDTGTEELLAEDAGVAVVPDGHPCPAGDPDRSRPSLGPVGHVLGPVGHVLGHVGHAETRRGGHPRRRRRSRPLPTT